MYIPNICSTFALENEVSRRSLIWKIPLALVGVLSGVVLLLLITVTTVLCVPSWRTKALEKGVEIANEMTDYDIGLERLYLSPFHRSPKELYRAYKGKADLPLEVEIDSLFIGHRGQDTLLYTHALRLRAKCLISHSENGLAGEAGLTSIPIEVDELLLDETTFHSDSMIAAVGIDAIVNRLELTSPGLLIAEGKYSLHGLRLDDAFVGIDLRDTPPDITAQDTTPMLMAFDVPDGILRNFHFRLTPLGMDVSADYLSTNVLADVGANLYDARRIDIGDFTFSLGALSIPADTIYGNACVNLADNRITSSGLHVRSNEMGAKADLHTTEMNLTTMRVDVVGDAEYQGSKARLRGYYDIDDEAYDMHADVERVNLSAFMKDQPRVIIAGDLHAQGQGIDPSSAAMKSRVHLHLTDAVYKHIDVSGLLLDAELANKTVAGTLHLPLSMNDSALQVRAQTEHQFRVAEFMKPERMAVDYHMQARQVRTHVAGEDFAMDLLQLDFATDSATSLDLATKGLNVTAHSPMQVLALVDKLQPLLAAVSDSTVIQPITSLSDLTMLDTIRQLVPEMDVAIELKHGSPAQHIIERMGLNINEVDLSLASNAQQTDLSLSASIPEINHPEDSTTLRLPAAKATMDVQMTEGETKASLSAVTQMTDGAMSIHDLCADANLRMDLKREGRDLSGNGRLTLDSINYGNRDLGSHAVDMQISPSQNYENALRADVQMDDIPLDLAEGFVSLTDIALRGAIRATAE